ncbi:MAG TPA: M20/M25/M40 family metallo-hydrolase [Acidobacteriota bacterium]|nr:M20/M25/M40 family metallo-hydrolase [Acidobacteriota bacterium]
MASTNPLRFRRYALPAGLVLGLTILVALSAWSLETAAPSATDEILRHVKFLASAETTGRGVDTPGIINARNYIAAEFAKYGLRAGGDNDSYLQSFDVAIGVTVREPSSLQFDNGAALALNDDWTPLGVSASDIADAPLVFAGYGITAKDYGYDDYAGIDVKGKIVLLLRYEPPPKDAKSPFRKPPDYSNHSTLRAKANNARDHGAAGMILVDLNQSGDERTELITTGASLARDGNSVVAAQIKRRALEKWLDSHGVSLEKLKEKIDREEKPASKPIADSRVKLIVTLQENHARADNIVALLPGADPTLRDQNIVIGAHYDHLGFGHFGARNSAAVGQIHPGADDNASGTAMLLDLARRLSQLPIRPARSIVFVAFSGEELGLFGSRHFVNHSEFINGTKAMLNLDMVGRLRDNGLTVSGGRSGQNFSKILTGGAQDLALTVGENDDVGRSDHLSFYNKRIPVLHFSTGLHSDYHRPSDTWDKLNIDGMARISDLVLVTALKIANTHEPINFVSLPSRPPTDQMDNRGGIGVYLGTMPDYGAESAGVRLAGVTDGSPAARAGLREGDVIVKFGDAKIQNIEDLAAALRIQKPGNEVSITVLRGGNPVTVRATLRGRS